MLIKEILQLTQEMPLADIAKTRLEIGERKAREALKASGCYNVSGKKGWYCDNPETLERSIYDFTLTKTSNNQIQNFY